MSGATAMTVLAGAAAAGTAYSVYAGERAAGQQQEAADRAKQQARVQADLADQAMNAANKKRANAGAAFAGAVKPGSGGASTMLTGPGGVDTSALTLGGNTLLGS